MSDDIPWMDENEFNQMFHQIADEHVEFKIEDPTLAKGFEDLKEQKNKMVEEARVIQAILRTKLSQMEASRAAYRAKRDELNQLVMEKHPEEHTKLGANFKVDYRDDGVWFTTITEREKREALKKKAKAEAEAGIKGFAYAYNDDAQDEDDEIEGMPTGDPCSEEFDDIIKEIQDLGGDDGDTDFSNFDMETLITMRDALREAAPAEEQKEKEADADD